MFICMLLFNESTHMSRIPVA